MRHVALSSLVLALTACSGGESESSNLDDNMMMEAPPFDVEVPNTTGETKAERDQRLREKAKTDPEGADAEAIDNMSHNEVLATAINSAGYLCARVVSAYPVGGNINVECVEYRNGKGKVRYTIDPNAGRVEPR